MKFKIKSLDKSHWSQVRQIYQDGIDTRLATFETKPPSWEDWDKNHHPFCRFVACDQETVAGWTALLPVSGRKVYSGVAEVSIYIAMDYQGKGLGKQLMTHLIEESEKAGIWTLQVSLFRENEASVRLHRNSGFREIGYREKVAKLDGKWKDTVIMERRSSKI